MGADLYRDDHNYKDESTAWRHPHYFRDSYNDSSLFWKIDLSWWRDLDKLVGPNADGVCEKRTEEWDGQIEEYDDYSLYPEGMRKLEKIVRERAELLAYNIRDLPDETDPDGPLDKKYFFEKFDQFLDFLRQAAEGGHTIHCSV